MAHPDDITGADGDWFTAAPPPASERPSAAADEDAPRPRVGPPSRRLTVLADRNFESDDDGWLTDAPSSYDAATETLRSGAAGPAARPSWWRRHRSTVAVTASLLVLVGAVGVTAVFLTGATEDTLAADPAPLLLPTTQAASPVAAEPAAGAAAAADFTWCAGQGAGEPVTEDTTDPGLSAIWRFERAFYYDRDPVAARAVGAPEAVMASAERLRMGIDALEPAVEFCVLADPVSSGVYDVTVVERGPGIDPRTSSQRFTTAESGGTTSITAITRR